MVLSSTSGSSPRAARSTTVAVQLRLLAAALAGARLLGSSLSGVWALGRLWLWSARLAAAGALVLPGAPPGRRAAARSGALGWRDMTRRSLDEISSAKIGDNRDAKTNLCDRIQNSGGRAFLRGHPQPLRRPDKSTAGGAQRCVRCLLGAQSGLWHGEPLLRGAVPIDPQCVKALRPHQPYRRVEFWQQGRQIDVSEDELATLIAAGEARSATSDAAP
jgi:hypothetical protein